MDSPENVHPNTWDAIESYDQARVAHNTIHFSREDPSHLVLPITKLGAGTVYDPAVHVIAKKTKPWDK